MGKEKKEIGKLLELLNEYSKNIGYFNEEDLQGQTKAWILSKEFGWIGWLVENDKIDTFRILEKRFDTQKGYEREHYHTVNEGNTDLLLMLLSISDTPIDDLISYLK